MERTINGPDKETLSAKEAADFLNIPETAFETLVDAGIIPPGAAITMRTIRWPWEQIVAIKYLLAHLAELHARFTDLSSPSSQGKIGAKGG